jgi:hypothetical protein
MGRGGLGYGLATASACPLVWSPGYGHVRSCAYGYPAVTTRVVHVAPRYRTRVVYASPRRTVVRRVVYRAPHGVTTIRRVYH